MPKIVPTTRVQKRIKVIRPKQDVSQEQCCVERDKENNLTVSPETAHNDSILKYMKVEVKEEELDTDLDFCQEISIPLEIDQYQQCNNIKQEPLESDTVSTVPNTSSQDLNMLIEWALNLQYDHSLKCKGRLYPSKEIFDNFNCKIIVLYCTVCKKQMLHTLKEWSML